MAAGNMSSGAVAMLAGISTRATFHLLHGRFGRPVRRISPELARKLIGVRPVDAVETHRRMVPARATRSRLGGLLKAGSSEADLAARLGLSLDNLTALVTGKISVCSHLTALRVAAEASELIQDLASAA